MKVSPPLEDIAELNIKSYQIQSDYDNQLHISAVPMLAFFGFQQQQKRLVLALVKLYHYQRAAVQVTLSQMVTALMHKKTGLTNLDIK